MIDTKCISNINTATEKVVSSENIASYVAAF